MLTVPPLTTEEGPQLGRPVDSWRVPSAGAQSILAWVGLSRVMVNLGPRTGKLVTVAVMIAPKVISVLVALTCLRQTASKF